MWNEFETKIEDIEHCHKVLFAHTYADNRADFARNVAAVKDNPFANTGILFKMYDNKDYMDTIWKIIKPTTLEYPSIGIAEEAENV